MHTEQIAAIVRQLPKMSVGTVVLVNTETGETIAAATEADAFEAFEEKYGWGVPAAVHVVRH